MLCYDVPKAKRGWWLYWQEFLLGWFSANSHIFLPNYPRTCWSSSTLWTYWDEVREETRDSPSAQLTQRYIQTGFQWVLADQQTWYQTSFWKDLIFRPRYPMQQTHYLHGRGEMLRQGKEPDSPGEGMFSLQRLVHLSFTGTTNTIRKDQDILCQTFAKWIKLLKIFSNLDESTILKETQAAESATKNKDFTPNPPVDPGISVSVSQALQNCWAVLNASAKDIKLCPTPPSCGRGQP